jgi:hypothetical protein
LGRLHVALYGLPNDAPHLPRGYGVQLDRLGAEPLHELVGAAIGDGDGLSDGSVLFYLLGHGGDTLDEHIYGVGHMRELSSTVSAMFMPDDELPLLVVIKLFEVVAAAIEEPAVR